MVFLGFPLSPLNLLPCCSLCQEHSRLPGGLVLQASLQKPSPSDPYPPGQVGAMPVSPQSPGLPSVTVLIPLGCSSFCWGTGIVGFIPVVSEPAQGSACSRSSANVGARKGRSRVWKRGWLEVGRFNPHPSPTPFLLPPFLSRLTTNAQLHDVRIHLGTHLSWRSSAPATKLLSDVPRSWATPA